MRDIRDDLFRSIYGRRFRAALTAERAGVLAGTEAAKAQADELGIELELCKADGEDLMHGERIGTLVAAAKQVALAEERMIGALAKASGIATAARTAVLMADGRAEIVSGSWKKMPPQIKELVRGAILTGGANCRIAEQPMIYLDKNYIRMLGSIPQALAACASFHEYTKVVQLRGESATVAWETQAAVRGGADILMVDTGAREDLECCLSELVTMGCRGHIKVAFAGNVKLTDIPVMVVDVRPRHITFDVLERNVPQAGIMGKERAILSSLAALPGVCLTDKSYIHSNGILGLICADVEEPEAVLDRVSNMTREIQEKVSRRAIVFPTGFELKQGMIQDTNTPFLKHELEERGYYVTVGEVMEDNVEDVVEKLDDALSRGFGLIVTTGGVGAEDKDHSVEGVCRMDPTAATPYIVKFQQGTGRHVKDGVRIGVGVVGPSRMVALPGPHDEVMCAAPVLLRGLEENWDKETLADRLAAALADKWRRKGMGQPHHHNRGQEKG